MKIFCEVGKKFEIHFVLLKVLSSQKEGGSGVVSNDRPCSRDVVVSIFFFFKRRHLGFSMKRFLTSNAQIIGNVREYWYSAENQCQHFSIGAEQHLAPIERC